MILASGKIIAWKADRGFGFVKPRGGGSDVFLHIADLRHAGYEPRVGDDVDFSLKKDASGRSRAVRAVVAGVPRRRRDWAGGFSLLIPVGFFLIVAGTKAYWPAPIIYLVASVLAFVVYGVDKQSAKRGERRTSEAMLHWIGFLGGWPGAILAQEVFRHKTRKHSFQVVFWVIAIGHVCLWAGLAINGTSPGELVAFGRELMASISR